MTLCKPENNLLLTVSDLIFCSVGFVVKDVSAGV